ncbi:MAG: dihydrodipicolinate synthase/N-acetylneuraminate lyase [Verrucomicrobiales bacterium]|jgi:dihydrodipicolinate synthase/N-acetylneuraminate lyase
MNTTPITPDLLAGSVIAVPPLARNADFSLNREENEKIFRHIESGGVTTMLYGGNANFYHVRPSEFASLLTMLAEISGPDTTTIPAVGPSWGVAMDQAEILRDFDFPTAMLLPQVGLTTDDGVVTGIRKFAEAYGKKVVVYIKNDGFISVEGTKKLVDDGIVSWIKYAVVRDNPSVDPFLRDLVESVDPNMIISGIGEQPAIVHLRDFGVVGFTAGCVCVAPRLSQQMLKAIKAGDFVKAEELRGIFKKLEDLRNEINPIRVLHEAVEFAGIAKTGPLLPLLSGVEEEHRSRVREAAQTLFAEN